VTGGERELNGRVALVTGSARNIGRAIALDLAAAGACVMVHARASRAEAEAVAAEIRALGTRAGVWLADVASRTPCDVWWTRPSRSSVASTCS
jgi:3-oxoacyl-[acyl-carrier protein] reductase